MSAQIALLAMMLAVSVTMTSSYVLSTHLSKRIWLQRAPLKLNSGRKASYCSLRMLVSEVKSASELDSIVSAAGDKTFKQIFKTGDSSHIISRC